MDAHKEEGTDRRTGCTGDERNSAEKAMCDSSMPGKSQNQIARQYHGPHRNPGQTSGGGMQDRAEMKIAGTYEQYDQRNRERGKAGSAENKKNVEVHKYESKNHSVTVENKENEMEPYPDYIDHDTESTSKNMTEECEKALIRIKELDVENKELTEKLKKEKSEVDNLKEELKRREDVKNSNEKETEMQNQCNHCNKYNDNSQNETKHEEHTDKRGRLQYKQGSNNEETQQQIEKLRTDLEKMKKENDRKIRNLEAKLQNEEQVKSSLEAQVKKITFEKNEALTRLSEIAGRRLLDNNPSIADLSTEIRPTKIGENFKQLYDNEWTEAFEELTEEGKTEEECIIDLLLIVQDTFTFAMKEAKNFESSLISIVTSFPGDARSSKKNTTKDEEELIKQLKRVSAARTSTAVQDMYLRRIEVKENKGERLKSYAMKCMELCWYMAVQSPPMVIVYAVECKGPFDEKYYTRYTATGDLFDYVVWPCTLLHEKGPILAKGVAQATKGDREDFKRKRAPAAPKQNTDEHCLSTKPDSPGKEGMCHEDNPKIRYQKRDEKNKSEQKVHDIHSKTEECRFGQSDGSNKPQMKSKSLYVKSGTNEETSAGGLHNVARGQSINKETGPEDKRGKHVTTIKL
ncbi:reticulocyte-binding protein homolog 2a-like [Saccostrea echinata]|uniref:reticulocyte-binding protein homolog 2a-like n=1 Tax=Saccostrea echinata TaxID=191078 RepID=UPI002A81A2C1|nr:reticulocyte-binding protein homolog 2a-like [Saccostrea echinata]